MNHNQSIKALSRPLNLKSGKGVFVKAGVTGEMLGFGNKVNRGGEAQAIERIKNRQPTAFQSMIKPFLEEGFTPKEIAEKTRQSRQYIYSNISTMKAIYGAEWYAKVKEKRDDRNT